MQGGQLQGRTLGTLTLAISRQEKEKTRLTAGEEGQGVVGKLLLHGGLQPRLLCHVTDTGAIRRDGNGVGAGRRVEAG